MSRRGNTFAGDGEDINRVGILDRAGCLEVTRVEAQEGTTQVAYRIKPDVMLDSSLLKRLLTSEGPQDLLYNWLEFEVDQIGKAQLLEILRNARLAVLMVEEQSVGRREMTGETLTPVVFGMLGFRPNTGEAGR